MIIDFHAHIFPDKIADRAAEGIGSFYGIKTRFDGRVSTLLEINRTGGVDIAVVQSVATVPEQVQNINNFISQQVSLHPRELIGFGSLHPDFLNIDGEASRIKALGLRGIKLHPDFQRFNADDKAVFPVYKAAVKYSLPVLIHAGDSRFDFSSPQRIYNAVEKFPDMTLIAAHLGGWTRWNEAEQILAGSNIYYDLSSSLYALSPERAAEIIRSLGTKRVFFGTDYPMWQASEELERFDKLPLSDEEKQDILYKNAAKLLNIEIPCDKPL